MKIGRLSNLAAVSVRCRAMIGAGACAAASALILATGAAPAQAETTCTWGGTPAAPTGQIHFDPGLTNTPAPFALNFYATGVVEGGGPCHGQTVIFTGQADAGSTCLQTSFEGRMEGLPGVSWAWGKGAGTVVRELDYDKHGNVVGSDQAIAQTPNNDPLGLSCNTPQGFTTAPFSGEFDLTTP